MGINTLHIIKLRIYVHNIIATKPNSIKVHMKVCRNLEARCSEYYSNKSAGCMYVLYI